MEATDSDELRNDDGDEVVDPPEQWSGVDQFGMSADEERQGAPLDQRLAEEEPDVMPADIDPRDPDDGAVDDEAIVGSDAAPDDPGTHRGQVDGAP